MRLLYSALTLSTLLLSLCSCIQMEPEEIYSSYSPVLMSRAQLEKSVSRKEPQPLSRPGKIYRYKNLLLINEQYKGVHVINNQDPTAPQNIAFLQVPGTIDLAVKQDILYVDNAVDLVAIDISDLDNIRLVKRIANVFPELPPPDHFTSELLKNGPPKDAVIVRWELKKQ